MREERKINLFKNLKKKKLKRKQFGPNIQETKASLLICFRTNNILTQFFRLGDK